METENDCMREMDLTPKERKRLRIMRTCTALFIIVICSFAMGTLVCNQSNKGVLKKGKTKQVNTHETRDSIIID